MKKLFLAAAALFLMAASVFAQSAVAPRIKFGSLTANGQMTTADLKAVNEIMLADAPGQSVVSFEIQIVRPDGQLVSRAPVKGSRIPGEFQTMISREKLGSRVVVKDVWVKEEKTGNTRRAAQDVTIEII